MKKFLSFVAAVFFLSMSAFCGNFTDYENSLVKQVLQIKLESRMFQKDSEALDFVQTERVQLFNGIGQKSISDEARLTIEKLFVLEEYHFMWEMTPDSPAIKDYIMAQFEKVSKWNADHDFQTRNEWYNLSAYDLINSAMPHLGQARAIKYGLEEKKVYDHLVNSGSSTGLLFVNAGLWYYFAPKFGGGSYEKAVEYFSKAGALGKTAYERYFGLVYLSQAEFDNNDMEAYKNHLAQAEAVFPKSAYVQFVRRMNQAGCSVLDYANNRKKVDEKVNKYYSGK